MRQLLSSIRLGVACLTIAGVLILSASGGSCAESATPSGGWEFRKAGEQNWAAQPPVVPGGVLLQVEARVPFNVSQLGSAWFWEFTHGFAPGLIESWSVNDKAVPLPLPLMRYRTLPGIPAAALREGTNTLLVVLRVDNRIPEGNPSAVMKEIHVAVPEEKPSLVPQKLAFRTGPILGAFDREFISVTCMTTVPVPATLNVTFPNAQPGSDGKSVTAVSQVGYVHRFHLRRPPGNNSYSYQIEAILGKERAATEKRTVRLPAWLEGNGNEPMKFVAMGDIQVSETRQDNFKNLAAAVLKENPDFIVFSGDFCNSGPNDWEWDGELLASREAQDLFATVPFYPAWGNHEENASIFQEVFYTPSPDGRSTSWEQNFGQAHIIGMKWSWKKEWEKDLIWLEKVLKGSKSPFIFFVSHYPAWSSGHNGTLNEKTGEPKSWSYQTLQKKVVPLLAKYQVTALLVGHEHHYERSGLPGGVVQIISGGAGGPLAGKTEKAAQQNPYSKQYAKTHHYSLYEIQNGACTFTAKTPEGTAIEKIEWKARQ